MRYLLKLESHVSEKFIFYHSEFIFELFENTR